MKKLWVQKTCDFRVCVSGFRPRCRSQANRHSKARDYSTQISHAAFGFAGNRFNPKPGYIYQEHHNRFPAFDKGNVEEETIASVSGGSVLHTWQNSPTPY